MHRHPCPTISSHSQPGLTTDISHSQPWLVRYSQVQPCPAMDFHSYVQRMRPMAMIFKLENHVYHICIQSDPATSWYDLSGSKLSVIPPKQPGLEGFGSHRQSWLDSTSTHVHIQPCPNESNNVQQLQTR